MGNLTGQNDPPASSRARRPGLRLVLLITVGVLAVVVAFAVVTPMDRLDPKTAIPWRSDIGAAAVEAKQLNRPVLMHFTAEWCGPCQQMKQWVYPRKAVAALIGERYIPLLVDLTDPNEQQMEAAGKLGIEYIPTIILFAPDGTEIRRQTGGMSAGQLTDMLQSALADLPARADPTSASPTDTTSKGTQP